MFGKQYRVLGIFAFFAISFSFSMGSLNAYVPLSGTTKQAESEKETRGPAGSPFFTKGAYFLALDTGYRWDKISNRVTLSGPTISVKGSTQLLKNINTYQLGAIGQWNFCKNGFIRGNGHYGWVLDGDYREGGFHGDLKGHTYDAEASIGYYFSLTRGVWIAPIFGWSYDAFLVRGDHIEVAINGKEFHLSDIRAYQRFNGPFLGFDLAFQPNQCWEFTFGYEFHYARWTGDRLIEGREFGNPPFGWSTGFSNKRHIDRVYGHVFRLDGAYQFCNCWTGGLELKYDFFNGDFGKYRQTKKPLISKFTHARVNGLWWRSFAAKLFLGRVF